jgi:hypothetical protein
MKVVYKCSCGAYFRDVKMAKEHQELMLERLGEDPRDHRLAWTVI